jgi:hypothetical protein
MSAVATGAGRRMAPVSIHVDVKGQTAELPDLMASRSSFREGFTD